MQPNQPPPPISEEGLLGPFGQSWKGLGCFAILALLIAALVFLLLNRTPPPVLPATPSVPTVIATPSPAPAQTLAPTATPTAAVSASPTPTDAPIVPVQPTPEPTSGSAPEAPITPP